jgi:hypothetical protein
MEEEKGRQEEIISELREKNKSADGKSLSSGLRW